MIEPAAGLRRNRPAGALPSFMKLGPASDDDATAMGLYAYADAVAGHCPYLSPSMRSGQTRWTRCQVVERGSLEGIEAAVFAAGVDAAEYVRRRRAEGARLACVVVTVGPAPHVDERALAWPHWVLKVAYAPVGVVAGKFWPGQSVTDRNGHPVPSPPLPLLALRTSMAPADARLLARTPRLAALVAQTDDDGRDVFARVGGLGEDVGKTWPRVRSWAADQLEGEEYGAS